MIVPTDRRYTWTPGTTVGVKGGVPTRTTIVATADAATYGTGAVDAAAHIAGLINGAENSEGVVYLPAGTYRVDSQYYNASWLGGATIRGELDASGNKLTTIKTSGATVAILFGKDPGPQRTTQTLTGGGTAGSTQFTIADTTNVAVGGLRAYAVGDLVQLTQLNPSWVRSNADPSVERLQKMLVRVTSVPNGTTVNFEPPLPYAVTSTPQATHLWVIPTNGVGLEDIILDGNNVSALPLQIQACTNSWVKNVEIKNSTARFVTLQDSMFCELRRNYFHDATTYGPNHEAVDFLPAHFCLIEDNIFYLIGGINLSDADGGSCGNVVGYNYNYGNYAAAGSALSDNFINHGPHNSFNLIEGNFTGGVHDDGYHGSSSHATVARNWLSATAPVATLNRIAVALGRWSNYNNFIGNVLGDSAYPESGRAVWKIGYPNIGNYDTNGLTWGPTTPPTYVNQYANGTGGDGHGVGGTSLQERDLNVAASSSFHGNYDYDYSAENPRYGTAGFVNAPAQRWEINNDNVEDYTDRAIPDSYYTTKAELIARGVVFGALAFPVIDPASPPGVFNDTNMARLPAGYRFVNGTNPSVPTVTPTLRSARAPRYAIRGT